jgi:2-methylcitrate dehydratase PrpD
MLSRITLVPHEEWAGERYREIPVELRLRDGRVHAESMTAPRGSRTFPLTPDEIRAKFVDCARRAIGSERAVRASDVVWAMREVSQVRALIDEVALPAGSEPVGIAPVAGATGRAG